MVTTVPALRGFLDLDDKDFNAVLNRAEGRTRSSAAAMNRALATVDRGWQRSGRSVGRAVGGMLRSINPLGLAITAISTVSLPLLVNRAVVSADAIGKQADAIGVSTDALQEYRFAANLSGVETQKLDQSLKFATKSIGELRTRTSSELTTALKDFDAQLLANIRSAGSVEEALDLVFRRMGQLEDATQRAALAKAVFGRAGIDLTNIVREGAAGLDRMRQQARDLGLVIDEDLIRSAETANDQFTLLSQVIKTQFTVALLQVAPEIGNLSQELAEGIPQLVAWTTEFLKFTGIVSRTDLDRLAEIQQQIGDLNAQFGRMPFGRPTAGAEVDRLRRLEAERNAILARMREGRETGGIIPAAAAGGGEVLPDPVAAAEATKELDRLTSQFQALEGSLDPTAAAMARYTKGAELLDRAQAAGLIPTQERYLELQQLLKVELEDATAATAELGAETSRAQSIIEATRTPAERYAATVSELNALYRAGAIDATTWSRAIAQAGQQLEQTEVQARETGSAARELGLTFSSAFEDAIVDGEKLTDILEGLEMDLLRLGVRKSFTEPLLEGLSSGASGRVQGQGLEGAVSSLFATASSPFRSGAVPPGVLLPPPPPAPRGIGVGGEAGGEVTAAAGEGLAEVAEMATLASEGLSAAEAGATAAGGTMSGSLVGSLLETVGVKTSEQVATTAATNSLAQLTASATAAAAALRAVAAASAAGGAGGAARGGLITGPGSGVSDSIPMRLSDGEFVVNAASTRRHLGLLRAINADRLPGLAAGGLVEIPTPSSSGFVIPNERASGGPDEGGGQRPVIVHFHGMSDAAGIRRNMPQIRGWVREMFDEGNRRDR